MNRIARATDAIRQAIATVSDGAIPLSSIAADEDLIDDLGLCPLELEGLAMIVEEIFAGISVDPQTLWAGAWHRTPESFAAWCITQSDLAAELELQRQRRRA